MASLLIYFLTAWLNEDGLGVNGEMILFYRQLAATFLCENPAGETAAEGCLFFLSHSLLLTLFTCTCTFLSFVLFFLQSLNFSSSLTV